VLVIRSAETESISDMVQENDRVKEGQPEEDLPLSCLTWLWTSLCYPLRIALSVSKKRGMEAGEHGIVV
jgi:hypothetical protein